MTWRIGIDSGGTFTDVCLFNEETGELRIWKVPSTPKDPSQGIVAGTKEALEQVNSSPDELSYFGHGTTVATNALIEHKGAKTALYVTNGFRDLLEIGRQKRPSLYDIFEDKPEPLVPRNLRFEVNERILHNGDVEIPFDEFAFREKLVDLKNSDVESIAVCFIYGFLNEDHEIKAKSILEEEFPDCFISISHEVAPEFREFERLTTTVVNAYLGPVMDRYIQKLEKRLRDSGLRISPKLTQSNGGVIGFSTASKLPVRTVLSGPSTGVVAAQNIGNQIGIKNIITFDVGGTSSDVALLKDGLCGLATQSDVQGYPIKAPMLDIHTVGAGGGSIAYVDSGGLLKVGPESAGANPGPVCYGLGNQKPTVTDANIALGTLNPSEILGGRMKVRKSLAVNSIEKLSNDLGLSTMETAQGIISVLTANMAKAIRVISVQRGYDPRDYALMAFGGAGPLHAARLARELDMEKIIIPLTPGTLCATGLLLTDLRADFAVSRLVPLNENSIDDFISGFEELSCKAKEWFEDEKISPENRKINKTLDVRYSGQNYELPVTLNENEYSEETLELVRKRFEDVHYQRFGFISPETEIQVVTLRLEATGVVPKATTKEEEYEGEDASLAISGMRDVWFPESGGNVMCNIYDRSKLRPGNVINGPAIIDQMDTTTVLLPDMRAEVHPSGTIIVEVNA